MQEARRWYTGSQAVSLRSTREVLPACILFLLIAGCGNEPEHAPAIGEAYAGPATLNLRRDISLQSPVVASVKHGEKLEVLQHRRRFMKVRTGKGTEGWADDHLLLSPEEINRLKEISKAARGRPSQGIATTYEVLNVHTEPSRPSPSFLQIREGEKVDVLGRMLAPRSGGPRKALIPPAPKRTVVKKKPEESKYPPIPLPPPPKLPENWLQLSKTHVEKPAEPVDHQKAPEPVPMDDWTFIRTAGGQTGWVLSRRLVMAIPDDVAQYAEGRRITSYFPLGEVKDGDEVKRNWLWTTIGQGQEPYDFDSFRVFIWSLRRHRYETAHIERNLKGFFPVLLQPVELTASGKAKGAEPSATSYPGFSVCVEKADGVRYRRSYAFMTNIVRVAAQRPCEGQASDNLMPPPVTQIASAMAQSPAPPGPSVYQRVTRRLKRLLGR